MGTSSGKRLVLRSSRSRLHLWLPGQGLSHRSTRTRAIPGLRFCELKLLFPLLGQNIKFPNLRRLVPEFAPNVFHGLQWIGIFHELLTVGRDCQALRLSLRGLLREL